jgi:hypothetical protein
MTRLFSLFAKLLFSCAHGNQSLPPPRPWTFFFVGCIFIFLRAQTHRCLQTGVCPRKAVIAATYVDRVPTRLLLCRSHTRNSCTVPLSTRDRSWPRPHLIITIYRIIILLLVSAGFVFGQSRILRDQRAHRSTPLHCALLCSTLLPYLCAAIRLGISRPRLENVRSSARS